MFTYFSAAYRLQICICNLLLLLLSATIVTTTYRCNNNDNNDDSTRAAAKNVAMFTYCCVAAAAATAVTATLTSCQQTFRCHTDVRDCCSLFSLVFVVGFFSQQHSLLFPITSKLLKIIFVAVALLKSTTFDAAHFCA